MPSSPLPSCARPGAWRGGNPKTGEKRSLRAIAQELARLGHVNGRGGVFAAAQIRRLVAG